MVLHAVDLLGFATKHDRLTTLIFAAGVGLFVLMGLLGGVLIGL